MKFDKLKINKNKFTALLLTVILIVFQLIVISIAKNIGYSSVDSAVIIVSWLSVISIIVELGIWKKLTGEFFSPYGLFFIVLYIFTLGQTIGWTLGIDLGTRDWWNRIDHGMNHRLIFDGVIYSILSVSVFLFGSIFGEKISSNYKKEYKGNSTATLSAFNKIGKVFLLISIPAFILQTYYNFSTVISYGYASIYTEQVGSTTFRTIVSILSNFYQPSLLLLLISNRDKKNTRRIIILFMLIDVLIDLFVGGRSGAVLTILGILLAYHYFIKPINKKNLLYGAVGGYIGIAILNCIATIRNIPNKSLSTFFTALGSSFSNVIGSFIGELGWNLSSICWTMNLVPSQYAFRHGKSYLASFLSWIPSSFFGGKGSHPTVIYANLGDWLQRTLNMSYGPGYTMVAESYINFGWYGIIAMFVLGIIVAKFIAKIRKENSDDDILGATFQIVFIMTIMKSLVRSSFSTAFRIFFFNVLPLYILVSLITNKKAKN